MKTSSYTLIPSTTAGTANGNYDPLVGDSFSGDPAKAAAYYSKDKSLQTISWYLSGFVGKITFEATLDADSDTTNWFPIYEFEALIGSPLTENDYMNFDGNYTWIRATVTGFDDGVVGNFIQKISLGY